MTVDDVKKILLDKREERKQIVLDFFDNMKPFKTVDDIPDVPLMEDKECYEKKIVTNLIRCGAIPKEELIEGKTYLGACRNATEAMWNGKQFTYLRTKFYYTYEEKINHFQDDDGYDVFVPLRLKEDDK